MTVEVVSSPPPGEWDPRQQPFYFEFLGETTPVLDTSQGELAAVENADGVADGTRVFEYTWTIGHVGVWQHQLKTRRAAGRKQAFSETPPAFWDKLGGVGVIFVPARQQNPDAASSNPVDPTPKQVLARAVVYSAEPTPAPPDQHAGKDYLKLWIALKLPSVSE
jgi:hypothetical protein